MRKQQFKIIHKNKNSDKKYETIILKHGQTSKNLNVPCFGYYQIKIKPINNIIVLTVFQNCKNSNNIILYLPGWIDNSIQTDLQNNHFLNNIPPNYSFASFQIRSPPQLNKKQSGIDMIEQMIELLHTQAKEVIKYLADKGMNVIVWGYGFGALAAIRCQSAHAIVVDQPYEFKKYSYYCDIRYRINYTNHYKNWYYTNKIKIQQIQIDSVKSIEQIQSENLMIFFCDLALINQHSSYMMELFKNFYGPNKIHIQLQKPTQFLNLNSYHIKQVLQRVWLYINKIPKQKKSEQQTID